MTGRDITNRPSDADLRRLYVDDARSCPDIAREIGCDPTTVRAWLTSAGVPLRPRGHNNRFQPGQPSAFRGHRHSSAALAKIEAATRARGGVPYLRQGQHWLKNAPPEENPRWLGGVTPERQAFYRTPAWKAACVTVYARADGYCERCEADSRPMRRAKGAFHIHHIVSFKLVALRAEISNLVLLCRDCHLWVHSSANVDRHFLAEDRYGLVEWHARAAALWDAQAERVMAAANDPDPYGLWIDTGSSSGEAAA